MSQTTEAPVSRADQRRAPRHRRTKAVLAIAAGTALLLGGGGTYAYWSTEKALSATEISSGNLDLALGTGSWTLKGALASSPTTISNITNVRIVPGDVLTLTQPLTVSLIGDTLQADLKATAGTTFSGTVLGSNLEVKLTMPTNYGTANGVNSYRLTQADSGTPTATVTITFKPGTTGQTAVGTSVNLSDITFSLTQVAPPA